MDLVRIEQLRLSYPGQTRPVLDIDLLAVGPGERLALIGATGAGKTTLLGLIDGRLRGWHGRVEVLGQQLSPRRRPPRSLRRRSGFVFQEFALVDRLTVYDNVRNGRLGYVPTLASLAGRFTADDEAAVWAALEETGLTELAWRRVDRLSGGQRQRVAIARCLVQSPELLLADEPISNLDPNRAETVVRHLVDSCARRGAGLIISSHQPSLVARHVGRIVALVGGRIVFDGPPTEVEAELPAIYDAAPVPRAA